MDVAIPTREKPACAIPDRTFSGTGFLEQDRPGSGFQNHDIVLGLQEEGPGGEGQV